MMMTADSVDPGGHVFAGPCSDVSFDIEAAIVGLRSSPESSWKALMSNFSRGSSQRHRPATGIVSSGYTMPKAHIANHYLQACITGTERQGFATDALLKAAGIPPDWLGRPDRLLTEQQLTHLIKTVWRCTRDEFMGLAPYPCKNGVFALMAELAQQACTLGGMLRQSARFYQAVYDGLDIGLSEAPPRQAQDQESQAPCCFFRLHLQPDNDPDHMLQEFLLLMWQRFSSWLVGQQVPFASTCFNYPKPRHAEEYRAMFSGELLYRQAHAGFSLHPRFLQLPIVRTQTELQGFLKAAPAFILHRPDKDDSLQTRIILLLLQYHLERLPNLDNICRQLFLSPRTLRRKLKEEGSSLRQIKEMLRRDFAIKLLLAEHLSIAEISVRTGFSEPAAFCRAFKRWTGASPSDWRQ